VRELAPHHPPRSRPDRWILDPTTRRPRSARNDPVGPHACSPRGNVRLVGSNTGTSSQSRRSADRHDPGRNGLPDDDVQVGTRPTRRRCELRGTTGKEPIATPECGTSGTAGTTDKPKGTTEYGDPLGRAEAPGRERDHQARADWTGAQHPRRTPVVLFFFFLPAVDSAGIDSPLTDRPTSMATAPPERVRQATTPCRLGKKMCTRSARARHWRLHRAEARGLLKGVETMSGN